MKIDLSKNRGFVWQSSEACHCKGYAFLEEASYPDSKRLLEYVNKVDTSYLKDTLPLLNGCFCIVSESTDVLIAAVDRVRSFPLFYAIDARGELLLSDDAFRLRDLLPHFTPDEEAIAEFLLTGYVCGADTIHPGIKQMEAGQYLIYNKNTRNLKLDHYYRYIHREDSALCTEDLPDAMHAMHKALAQRLIQSLEGRTAAIPLSGGYDSRLIASLLKDAGYENVVCFSYGSLKGGEAQISKAAAVHLKLHWLFADYDRKDWFEAYQSQERKDFYRYATHLSASAHIQDWLAVKQLKEKGLLPQDCVFIPGHSGDFLEGTHLPSAFGEVSRVSRYALVQAILTRHYRLWDWKEHFNRYYPVFREKLCQNLDIPPFMDPVEAASLFEQWDQQERQAKFINNSVRVYEFFGSQWRLPLWDNAMLDFWAMVPLTQRLGRRLFLQYAQSRLNLPIAVYKGKSLAQRAQHKATKRFLGHWDDPRYGRFLDYDKKLQYLRAPIANLCREDIEYPIYISKSSPILHADINALQALVALKEWQPDPTL